MLHPSVSRMLDTWTQKEARLSEGDKAAEASMQALLLEVRAPALWSKVRRSCRQHAVAAGITYTEALTRAERCMRRYDGFPAWALAAAVPTPMIAEVVM